MSDLNDALERLREAIACECDGERSSQFVSDLRAVVDALTWKPITGDMPRGQAHSVIVAWKFDTAEDFALVGEAYRYEDTGDWWWANTGPGDPTGDALFPSPTHYLPLPAPPAGEHVMDMRRRARRRSSRKKGCFYVGRQIESAGEEERRVAD